MATTVTYNAIQYRVPAYQDTGYAQGSGNLSSYLIALATGSLTLSGGSFPLTADVDFGASFGLKSIYYKSRSANPGTTGVVRLGNTEVVAWRNAANNADLSLTATAANYLSFNGSGIAATATTNQIVLGTTNTTTINSTAPASSRTYTIPDAGTTASFVMTEGSQSIVGAKTFDSSSLLIKETGGGNDTVTIACANLGASRTYTIPDAGATASFVMTAGTQSITGAITLANAVTAITGNLEQTGNIIFKNDSNAQIRSLSESVTLSVRNAGITMVGAVSMDATTVTGGLTLTTAGDLNVNSGVSPSCYVTSSSGSGVQIRLLASTTTAGYVQTQSNHPLIFTTNNGANAIEISTTTRKSVVVGDQAIATNATDGFLYIPMCAGTPTGTPTSYAGRGPLVIDSTNHKLYFYDGAWRDVGP